MMPIVGTIDRDAYQNFVHTLVAESLSVLPEDILSMELCFYNTDKATIVGQNKDFLLSSRIDCVAYVYAGLMSIINAKLQKGPCRLLYETMKNVAAFQSRAQLLIYTIVL